MISRTSGNGHNLPYSNCNQQNALAAVNTAVVITLTGIPQALPSQEGRRWVIHQVIGTYNAAPTPTGPLVITDGVTTFNYDLAAVINPVTLLGFVFIAAVGATVTITLPAAGAAVVGHLNVVAENEG